MKAPERKPTKQERMRLRRIAESRCVNCGADLTPERPGNDTKLCNRCRRHKRRYYKRVVKPKLANEKSPPVGAKVKAEARRPAFFVGRLTATDGGPPIDFYECDGSASIERGEGNEVGKGIDLFEAWNDYLYSVSQAPVNDPELAAIWADYDAPNKSSTSPKSCSLRPRDALYNPTKGTPEWWSNSASCRIWQGLGKERLVAECGSPGTADLICRLQWAAIEEANANLAPQSHGSP